MIKLKKSPKIKIIWNVNPYDFSQEIQRNIQEKFSQKYLIPKESIKVVPNFLSLNEKGEEISLTNDIIKDINDKEFQISLFKEYLQLSNIEDYDFELIKKIDSEINDKINFDKFINHKRFSLKWIRWSNFLSYGQDNFFDFSKLNGMVLLHGEAPYQNQSGKTSFAIDLSHFLFFGRTSKTDVLSQVFNNKLDDETTLTVEGCVEIEGNEYIIKRVLTRPSLKKRTEKSKVSQKINYYRLVNDELEELKDTEEMNGESVQETNKIIKDAIGNEQDYDLMLCATSDNLDNLISMKDTERGRLLSRWIGLSCIEEKDIIARSKFNNEIKPKLLSNIYNRETLQNEIKTLKDDTLKQEKNIKQYKTSIDKINNEIKLLENNKKTLLEAKSTIDDNLIKIDIQTIEYRIESIINDGKVKREELEKINLIIEDLKDVSFDIDEYNKIQEKRNEINIKLAEYRTKYNSNQSLIKQLVSSEFCPTCGRKYENIDNSSKIEEIKKENEEIISNGNNLKLEIKKIEEQISNLKEKQNQFSEKNKMIVKKSTIELKIEQLLSEYKDKMAIKKEYEKNLESIKKNNDIDISLRNIEINLEQKNENLRRLNNDMIYANSMITNNNKEIDKRSKIIIDIENELVLLKNWKIYLELIGKNGISKMVLKRALPIINADLANMLNDVCDFSVSVEMTDKQEVIFYIIRDGIKSNLNSGSGFERTCASLALRSVLTKMNTLSKNDGLILDEILGRVASSNYDNMRLLYEKILNDYRYIIQVTHIDEVKDWHNNILCVSKINGISHIKLEK